MKWSNLNTTFVAVWVLCTKRVLWLTVAKASAGPHTHTHTCAHTRSEDVTICKQKMESRDEVWRVREFTALGGSPDWFLVLVVTSKTKPLLVHSAKQKTAPSCATIATAPWKSRHFVQDPNKEFIIIFKPFTLPSWRFNFTVWLIEDSVRKPSLRGQQNVYPLKVIQGSHAGDYFASAKGNVQCVKHQRGGNALTCIKRPANWAFFFMRRRHDINESQNLLVNMNYKWRY